MISKSKTYLEDYKLHPEELYQTPASLVSPAVDKMLEVTNTDRFLDVGTGEYGVWGYFLKKKNLHVSNFGCEKRDINAPEHYDHFVKGDVFKISYPYTCYYGNPPFSIVPDLLRFDREYFFLLKLSILSPKRNRKDMLSMRPFISYPLGKRPGWHWYTPEKNFTKNTNSSEYGLFYFPSSDSSFTGKEVRYDFDWKEDEILERSFIEEVATFSYDEILKVRNGTKKSN